MQVLLLVLLVAWSVSPVEIKKHKHPRGSEALINETRQKMEEYRKAMKNYKNRRVEELTLSQKDKAELQANLAKLKRKTVDDVEPTVDSIEEVNTALGIADGLFEGDIIISKEELKELAKDDDESRQKRQAYRSDTYPALWTDGVSYMFNQTLKKRARTAFRKAALLWESNTCINFTELVDNETNGDGDDDDDDDDDDDEDDDDDDEDDDDDNDHDHDDESEGVAKEETEQIGEEEIEEQEEVGEYYDEDYYTLDNDEKELEFEGVQYILVGDDNGCDSALGKQRFLSHLGIELQPLSLGRGCETIGTAAHELGHALGFLHTHTRYDRDEFITVNEQYVNQTYAKQFEKFGKANNNNFGLTYDYGSVMHYKATSTATKKGKLTLVPKDVLYTETLGSAMISFYDLLMMNMLYNCTATCGNSTHCNGGFPHPRNCSKCICPSGYGGQFCNERPSGCGEVLKADRNWTILEGNPYNMTFGYQDGYKKCHYWITGPNDTKVQVQIVNLPANVSDYGCKYAGVEIKTHTDQRLTGYRFCSRDDINATLLSNSSTVPVIMYMRRRRNHTDTVLQYRYVDENSSLQAE